MQANPDPGPSEGAEQLTITSPSLILAFSLCFAFFILAPAFLGQPFSRFDLMHRADILDIFTPLVLIPLYWLLLTDFARRRRNPLLVFAFVVLAALWTEGQGMHLSANSIGNLLGKGTTDVYALVHFYDEVLSHYLWHVSIVGLSVVLVMSRADGLVASVTVKWSMIIPAAIAYGFTYFAAINEGGTVPFGLPAAIVILVVLPLTRRRDLRSRNLTAFFFVGYLVSVLFFAGWYAYWRAFPEFSETGII